MDESSVNALTATYHDALYRFIRGRVDSREDARDLTQEAFSRVYSHGLERARQPLAFLFRTAVNLLIDRRRAAGARHPTHALNGDEACSAPSVERSLSDREQLRVLEQALAELPANCRTALVLHRFDGLSHAEIACALGVSVSMVEKHVKRALRHCRQRLAAANGDDG